MTTAIHAPLLALLVLLSGALAVSCGVDGNSTGDTVAAPTVRGSIAVFAAASLTDAFEDAATAFTRLYPATKVSFNFASSSALAIQISEGAPADLFASADQVQMEVVAGKRGIEEPRVFATNSLVLAIPRNGRAVAGLADLAKPGLRLVLAAKDVPAGRYAREALDKATAAGPYGSGFSTRVIANVRSEEPNVRAALTKVQLGEADAAIVYTTDLAAARKDARGIEIPAPYNVAAQYPIAIVRDSKNQVAAAAFIDFLLSPEGRELLNKYGFGTAVQ